ncbi:hypothetical protein DY000_02035292 [Brassica cretica]|uniref:Uncharacterized protein n=1 Tax=Brassica cretica TaxID=69181 RepID=A0ABQ7DI14_BRACR|nr:hypothetical protein DY000_02035292 [Brassica cretica]
MDRPRQTDHLGVNKTGKNIRKSPIHQPNFSSNANATARPQAQPQVYSVSKNDFNNNSPRPQNTRLQRVRPAPLTEINRPSLPLPNMPLQHRPHSFVQPPFPQGTQQPVMGHGDQSWSNTAESPISGYMRYLQSSLGDPGPSGNNMQPGNEHRPYTPAQPQPPPYNLHFPQFNGPVPGTPTLPSPRFNQMYGGFPSPRYDGGFPSPWYNSFGPLPSPTGYPNMFSPRSPYPLLSPGVQYPQPLNPNFSFSQLAQPGSHGPGAGAGPSQPPPSPGLMFPPSPSGFFPIPSPRWGGY